jgi:hypothetical protein
LLTRS